MVIDFRCGNCGKLLSADAKPSSQVVCPFCKMSVTVPVGSDWHGRPDAERDDTPARPPAVSAPPAAGPAAPEANVTLLKIMSAAMPWIISLFLHACVIVILAFIAIVTFTETEAVTTTVPMTPIFERLSENLNRGAENLQLETDSLGRTNRRNWADRQANIPLSHLGETEKKVALYGMTGGTPGAGESAAFGLTTGRGTPKSRFFGTAGNAYHIVYVVDHSGSMLDSFDEVRLEMLRSISLLGERQSFHVIFFTSGKPSENPPGRLVYATEDHKRGTLKYLKGIIPASSTGLTDPVPALKRAFAVLAKAPDARRGKLIYLLTDGDFNGPGNEAVRKAIYEMNRSRDVHVNTILFVYDGPEAKQVLKEIARENGGVFRFVQRR